MISIKHSILSQSFIIYFCQNKIKIYIFYRRIVYTYIQNSFIIMRWIISLNYLGPFHGRAYTYIKSVFTFQNNKGYAYFKGMIEIIRKKYTYEFLKFKKRTVIFLKLKILSYI